MDNLQKAIGKHKTLVTVVVLGFIVFINCFGFPVYNFEKTWPFFITIEYLLLPFISCLCIGGGLALLFPKSKYVFMLFTFLILTGIGLICRFLLEFGEVSNTYNFTLSNICFHIFIMVLLNSLSWLYVKKKS